MCNKSESKLPGCIQFLEVIPHTIHKTGHYCDGRFDPNHLDFESFCGFSTTRRTALPLAIFQFAYLISQAGIFGLLLHVELMMILNVFIAAFALLLIVGMLFERPWLMVPFICVKVK
jgi:hypothetical protein